MSKSGFHRLVDTLADRYEREIKAGAGKPRVVVVLGAGMSLWSRMPLWSNETLKRTILGKAEDCFSDTDAFLTDMCGKLSAYIDLPERPPKQKKDEAKLREHLLAHATLDQICAVACEHTMVRDAILRELRETFSAVGEKDELQAGPPPQLGCEILAHLVKHRLVDDVITFNFDEVFDRAMENELGEVQFTIISSDEQIRESGDRPGPHLIKLHGTISAPASLRFTADRTAALPPAMIGLLDKLLFGPAFGEEGEVRKVRIISFGYGWKDPDFVRWLASRHRCIEDVTTLTLESEPDLLEESQLRDRVHRLYLGRQSPSLDLVLWAVWVALVQRVGEKRIVPASRHFILSYLFGPADPSNPSSERRAHTLESRFRAEVLLHLLKAKGMVNMSVMARDCRLSRYCAEAGYARALDSLSDFMVRSSVADVKETFFAKTNTASSFAPWILGPGTKVVPDREVIVPALTTTGKISLKYKPTLATFLGGHIQKIFEGEEVEIVPGTDPRHSWLFKEATPLNTLVELHAATDSLLKRNWTHLLVIAESGAWLFADRIRSILSSRRSKNGKILVIESSTESLDDWLLLPRIQTEIGRGRNKLIKQGYWVRRTSLPWWQHNRHLTLAYQGGNKPKYAGAIYFRRRIKTSLISPVYTTETEDCCEILMTFLSYARRLVENQEGVLRSDRELDQLCAFLTVLCDVAETAPMLSQLAPQRDPILERFKTFLAENSP